MLPRERQVHLNKPISTICIILASVCCDCEELQCYSVTENRPLWALALGSVPANAEGNFFIPA
jgi:hypothetical protein